MGSNKDLGVFKKDFWDSVRILGFNKDFWGSTRELVGFNEGFGGSVRIWGPRRTW